MKLKYCPQCSSPMKISKRKPDYDSQTGELRGYYLHLVCSKPWWSRHGIWWDYEHAEQVSSKDKVTSERTTSKKASPTGAEEQEINETCAHILVAW